MNNDTLSMLPISENDYPFPLYIISYYDQLSGWNIKPNDHNCNGKNYCKICYDFYVNFDTVKIKHPCIKDTSCIKKSYKKLNYIIAYFSEC